MLTALLLMVPDIKDAAAVDRCPVGVGIGVREHQRAGAGFR